MLPAKGMLRSRQAMTLGIWGPPFETLHFELPMLVLLIRLRYEGALTKSKSSTNIFMRCDYQDAPFQRNAEGSSQSGKEVSLIADVDLDAEISIRSCIYKLSVNDLTKLPLGYSLVWWPWIVPM